MSLKNVEKSTEHNIVVRLLSETKITYASAVFKIAKSINIAVLEDEGLLILGYDFNAPEPGTHTKRENGSSLRSKVRIVAEGSPGALGDFYTFIKKYKWWQIYIGFAGSFLMATLLWKWVVRLITGQPFF